MANSNQILSLIKSHLEGNDKRFRELAMQIATSEAKSGHLVLSRSITDLLKKYEDHIVSHSFIPLNNDVTDLVTQSRESCKMCDLVCSEEIKDKINRVLREYVNRQLLAENNLCNRSRILLSGPSGTGKTMTASVIANELNLPLFIVRMEKIITKYMGETSLKLSKVFDLMSRVRGVYLFDEFDALGMQRGTENEVGEMRRVLNSFLQMMERKDSESLVIAATNNASVLDQALFRRFDDLIEYSLPSKKMIVELIQNIFSQLKYDNLSYERLADKLFGRSQAEITMICRDAFKESILDGKQLTEDMILNAIEQRSENLKYII